MKFDLKFKNMKYSESLSEYVAERFSKLAKYEIKPITVHVTFSKERHMQFAEVFIRGLQNVFRAKGESDSLYVSLDMCLKKLKRQMEKEKSIIKNHRHNEHSDQALLEEMLRIEAEEKRAA